MSKQKEPEAVRYSGENAVTLETCKKMCSVEKKCDSYFYYPIPDQEKVNCVLVMRKGAFGDYTDDGDCFIK